MTSRTRQLLEVMRFSGGVFEIRSGLTQAAEHASQQPYTYHLPGGSRNLLSRGLEPLNESPSTGPFGISQPNSSFIR